MNKLNSAFSTACKAVCTGKFWKELFIMTLGMFIAAAGVYYFLVPSKLVVGSISGLSIVISALFTNAGIAIKVSTIVLIINAILLLLAYFLIGSEFGIKTAYTALILGPMMDIWEKIYPYANLISPDSAVPSVMGDLWFDLICFVLILSASQAIMFSINASTGGLDILAKIVNKYFHFDIGMSVTIAGVIICCTAFFVNPFRLVIIGLIGTWINGLIVDYFMMSLSRKKRVCIISKDTEIIRDFIINKIGRGCSIYQVKGGFSGDVNEEIQSLLTKDEFADLMKWLRENNVQAFITAGNVSEVYGLWNKNSRHHKSN
ncbi:MAG: YitT family protein [Bacteroidia bacterium]|nr:YitT family protein [Bacteroidia bacterium]